MEIIQRDYSCGLIIDPKNRIFLQKKDRDYFWWPNFWCLFGGGIKNNEDTLEALVRETKEESGLNLFDTKFFLLQQFSVIAKTGAKKGILETRGNLYYFSSKFDGNLENIKLKEGAGFAVFDESELIQYNKFDLILPYNYKIIEMFYKSLKNSTNL